MASERLRFALFGNEYQSHRTATIQTVFDQLCAHGAEILVERTFLKSLLGIDELHLPAVTAFDGDRFVADYVISMGGDGTFLNAASHVGPREFPILGINTGRLGFLADVSPEEANEALESVFCGNYRVVDRSTLHVEVEGEPLQGFPYALNEVAVLKRDNASMISISAKIDGENLVTYQADGLIVSTPTGSTAYSLSNGGPIIAPQTPVFCLTPVAPHSLNIRPIVLSDKDEISLEVVSRSHNFLIAIDGRSEKLIEGTRLTLHRGSYDVHIIKRMGKRYFATLREKMMWGADKR